MLKGTINYQIYVSGVCPYARVMTRVTSTMVSKMGINAGVAKRYQMLNFIKIMLNVTSPALVKVTLNVVDIIG